MNESQATIGGRSKCWQEQIPRDETGVRDWRLYSPEARPYFRGTIVATLEPLMARMNGRLWARVRAFLVCAALVLATCSLRAAPSLRVGAQPAQLLDSHETGTRQVLQLEQRLEQIHAQFQENLRTRDRRIAELQEQLAAREQSLREAMRGRERNSGKQVND